MDDMVSLPFLHVCVCVCVCAHARALLISIRHAITHGCLCCVLLCRKNTLNREPDLDLGLSFHVDIPPELSPTRDLTDRLTAPIITCSCQATAAPHSSQCIITPQL